MASWWHRDIIAADKLPLMLLFLSFVVTFIVTRTITRMIRDGRGPFRNQVTAGGTHIHHAVPGIILLMIGAFTAIGGPDVLGWRSFAGVTAGIGMSLVLDEFALILHLQDVYWTGEGQLSVQMVSLVAACLGLAVSGFSPFGVKDADAIEVSLRLTASGVLIADGVLILICVLKGKYPTALLGLFLPPVGWIGAVRLARPSSVWARHRYSQKRMERAERRAADFDRRWDPVENFWDNLAGGKPSQPNPAPSEPAQPDPAPPDRAPSALGTAAHPVGQIRVRKPVLHGLRHDLGQRTRELDAVEHRRYLSLIEAGPVQDLDHVLAAQRRIVFRAGIVVGIHQGITFSSVGYVVSMVILSMCRPEVRSWNPARGRDAGTNVTLA
jgi:hypothetical protein